MPSPLRHLRRMAPDVDDALEQLADHGAHEVLIRSRPDRNRHGHHSVTVRLSGSEGTWEAHTCTLALRRALAATSGAPRSKEAP